MEQGYHSYLPQLIKRCRVRGRRVHRVLPLFPRYLFVGLQVGAQDLAPVKSTKGVLGIVRFGSEYARVPPQVIQQLQGGADARTGLHRVQERYSRAHATVRITGGAFEGLEGVYLRECGEDRVLILLNVLGQSTPVKVPEGLVEVPTVYCRKVA